MFLFFSGLRFKPVAEAVQIFAVVIVGHGEVKIGRVKFLVDLLLEQGFNLSVHDSDPCCYDFEHALKNTFRAYT